MCRVAYKRIPMDTPGAYQLIDEHTGEKFIVWGGSDDGGDDSIPSEQVLSWKPEAVKSSDCESSYIVPDAAPKQMGAQRIQSFSLLTFVFVVGCFSTC